MNIYSVFLTNIKLGHTGSDGIGWDDIDNHG
jgi:hypothetical protein